jgi:hypothetical protein
VESQGAAGRHHGSGPGRGSSPLPGNRVQGALCQACDVRSAHEAAGRGRVLVAGIRPRLQDQDRRCRGRAGLRKWEAFVAERAADRERGNLRFFVVCHDVQQSAAMPALRDSIVDHWPSPPDMPGRAEPELMYSRAWRHQRSFGRVPGIDRARPAILRARAAAAAPAGSNRRAEHAGR